MMGGENGGLLVGGKGVRNSTKSVSASYHRQAFVIIMLQIR